MPRKMAKLCRGKAVIVSVYEERPGKRRVSSSSNSHHHHHHHHHYVHHVIKQEIVAAPSKPRFSRSTSPTCLGNWKILIPNICRSLTSIQAKQKKKKKHSGSTSNAMITVMKSLEVQKKKGFILKLLSKLQRHR
ncbi:hypothetical protein POPTR_001G151150v4 [Populus trichocarpa]|uniref:Uncharacterized protein n=1 Tax=Populus trichocarpa TaxID=3694 RepID=A0A3N7EC83_POPTR|nr:hypothetical protein BDE02_01G137400 [Populus trichocarpa]RQO84929.1 hypothetical protein POPTR_001G151150v4 [Populus trichocarpa]